MPTICSKKVFFHFYSRPCGRGDELSSEAILAMPHISTHAPAGGATTATPGKETLALPFLLTPLREGRLKGGSPGNAQRLFLLTPLREGRPSWPRSAPRG